MLKTYTINPTELVLLDQEGSKYILKVRDLPQSEKPRERLIKYGPEPLSLSELLAIILNVGTKREEVLVMSGRLLKEYGEKALLHQTDPKKLATALDIPIGKACQLIACFALGKRFFKESGGKPEFLRTAKQVYEYVGDMQTLPKEHLRGIYLNSHYRLVHDEVISIGSLTANIVHPREVFKPAMDYAAVGIILVHNHPSGVTTPSSDDIDITKQLIAAGNILGIHLLDHIVVTKTGFASIPVNYS